MNRKGVSAVIVTVLIILISILAVSILWAVIRSSIQSSTEQVASAQQCLGFVLKIEEVKYYADQNNLTVEIHRDAGQGEMSEIKIIQEGKVSSSKVSLNELETKIYYIENVEKKPTKVEVAAVLSDGSICPVSDKKEDNQIIGV